MLTHRIAQALAIVFLVGLAACEREERGPPPAQETAPVVTPAPTPLPGAEPEGYGTEVDPIVADTAPPGGVPVLLLR